MSNIVLMGECMVEFGSAGEPGLYRQKFAGDVFNTAIYIKRCVKDATKVQFLSAVGNDSLSDQMISLMDDESVDSSLLYRSSSAQMGLYLIKVDDEGERSFTYWRDTSAAKQVVELLKNDGGSSRLADSDIFFFSGISIAILSPQDRTQLWHYISELKAGGTKIVFDPNYRPTLWTSLDETRTSYAHAFSLADVALPGVDDHMVLYDAKNAEDVAGFIEQFAISEIIIKNGAAGMLVSVNGERTYIDVDPVKTVVDTTSAGDAFNGGYLSARIIGRSVQQAAVFASKVSACVIQHKGAIVSKEAFNQQLADFPI